MNRIQQIALTLTAIALLFAGPVPSAFSQDKPSDNMQIVREKIAADKKRFVAANMNLTEKEADGFWPIYDQYQRELGSIADRTRALIESYAGQYETMTEEGAKTLLNDFVVIERDRLRLLTFYLSRFRKVVSEKKVSRYFQVENKIQALINFDLAAEIPLMK